MDDIAQRIQSRMEALELSARSLSLKAGLSERHVGKILERGSGGGAEGNTLVKIASALALAGLSHLPAWAAAERIIMCEDAA